MSISSASQWVEKLSQTEMPILSSVMRQLNALTGDDDAEVNQLAEVILKDPHLTSQILRMANSVQYNPSNNGISTISRAIVLLGFRAVRSLCISLMVVDSLLGKEPRQRLQHTMAKAFHAAVQARAIYSKVNDKQHEEVFIAALLHNLGEMAFWAYGGQTADKLDAELQHCLDSEHNVIEKELGTSFKMLSRELGKVWNLGDTLQESLALGPASSDRAKAVQLGEAISQLDPDDKVSRQALMQQVAAFTGGSMSETRELTKEATESVAAVAVDFGASQVCHLLPRQKHNKSQPQPQAPQVLSADPRLQLKVLRDLANSVNEGIDVNTVFQMTLEGMHRGIGLERVVLAFFNKDKIKAKYVLGQGTEGWRERFGFDTSPQGNTIFTDCITKPQPVWLNEHYIQHHRELYDDTIKALLGYTPAFIGVLRINQRNAALFYADRGDTKEPLTDDQFDSFSHFLSQAEIAVQSMANGRQR